ncbi:MAG TPA: hypothetical protein VMK12_31105 [Anaeromyxobacteraceae bacterium]|nr:hypothetical protein [Anaeromyxobacteraceae bacterium]
MNRTLPAAAVVGAALAVLAPCKAQAEAFAVNPEAGNNSLSAVFDAKLGERINAVSSSVGCELSYDEASGTVSGTCSVPLASIRVDNDDTKSDHFRQWATNKKSDPAACRIEAAFSGVVVGKLAPATPAPFMAEIPFRVCGRGRSDGAKEKVTGTALLFPAGSYGERKTIRVRATVTGFDRDAYRIGPKYTDGWLARVQSLAQVVAETGTIELSLFAKAK